MNEEKLYETAQKCVESRDLSGLKKCLKEMYPADVEMLMEGLNEKELLLVFRLLPKELAAEVFVEMDPEMQESLITRFTDKELSEVMSELYVDDTVDIIEEMPANIVTRLLKSADSETRKQINDILKYPKDSAGSVMTTEFVKLRESMTVLEAFQTIRRVGVDKETIYTCYVTERAKLIGVVTVKDMLLCEETKTIGEIMERNVIYVNTHDDKEETVNLMSKYDFMTMPVTDAEGRLVGIVTFDDAIDVIQEETTEDIEKMAAITPTDKPYLKLGVFQTWKNRIPWLALLMVSATFTGTILSRYEDSLAKVVALTAFIPMLMDSGGNAGSQASVTIIRGLSLEEIRFGDIFRVIWKEFRVSLLCGISLALLGFLKAMFIDRVSVTIGVVIALTLFVTIVCAKLVGCVLPMLAKKLGFDPAVMASPFITTIVEAIGLVVYFNIATLLLDALK